MSNVDHPSHYNQPGKKECIVEMEEHFGKEAVAIFDLLNAYKYLYRAGCKQNNPKTQDISKAKWYFQHANSLGAFDMKNVRPIYMEVLNMNID
jgi:hypothetical protein